MILRGILKNEPQQKFWKIVAENKGRVKIFLQKKLLQSKKNKRPKDFSRRTNLRQGWKSGPWPEISLKTLLWSGEKWFYIQGLTNFTAAHFVAKYHAVNSSQNPISADCIWDNILSFITQDSWPQERIGTKQYLKTDSFAVFESSRFVTTER